ncbi:hypothetical protein EBZ38_08090, partial [bacterium]|nr:hypothetical protein [bacterium]
MKFKISQVENLNFSNGKIEKINLKNSNYFDGWKFSILASSNDHIITNLVTDLNAAQVIKTENALKWRIIDHWKHEKDYATNSLVIYEETLFRNLNYSRIVEPVNNPKNSSDWEVYKQPTIFYSPVFDGLAVSNNMGDFGVKLPPLVHNYGEYYYSNGVNSYTFWDSGLTYSIDDIVTYKNKNWISLDNDNRTLPSETSGYLTQSNFVYTWEETNLPTRWNKVDLWKSDESYDITTWNSL